MEEAAGQGSNGSDNPFKLTQGQFESKLAATKAVLTDPAFRKHQGAKTLFTFYLEFSFEPRVGGLRAGSICAPLDLVVSLIHAKRHSIVKWKRLLLQRGYIWQEKIQSPTNSGWPWTVVHLSCLVPENDNITMFPSAHLGTWRSAVYGTWRNAALGTWVGAKMGTSRGAVLGTLSEGSIGGGRGGSDPPRSDQGSEDGFKAWQSKLARLYPRELESMLSRLTQDKAALNKNPDNFKLELKPEVNQWAIHAREEIAKLYKGTAKQKMAAAERQARLDTALKDASNYKRGALNPSAAASMANITRKVEALKEALR